MDNNRAGGCSGDVSVNPSADSFSRKKRNSGSKRRDRLVLEHDFSPKTDPPDVLTTGELIDLLSRHYTDAKTMQSEMFIDTAGYEHSKRYLPNSGVMSLRRGHDLMLFDIEYQSIVLKYIGLFEIAFRARYAREMAELRGPFAHRDRRNFINGDYFNEFLSAYAVELSRAVRNKGPMRDAYEEYGDLPIWKAVEVMTFGTLSKLYRNTKSGAVKRRVADAFGMDFTKLSSWLRTITTVRNACAHFNTVARKKLPSQPAKIDNVGISTSNHFYIVLILITLLHENMCFNDDFSLNHDCLLIRDISELIYERKSAAVDAGIPFNWRHAIIKTCENIDVNITFNEGSPSIAGRSTYLSFHGDNRESIIFG